ncbi:MAG: VacJ family lipoprotein [Bilophila sp.]
MTDLRSSRGIPLLLLALLFFYGGATQEVNLENRETPVSSNGGSLSILDASPPSGMSVADASDAAFEDYDDEASEQIYDPLEPWNRFWFRFNNVLLLDIIKPAYTGYSFVVHEDIRTGLSNVLYNLQMPLRLGNSLLQGKFGQAWVELGRFMINTTVGMGGVFDVAKRNKPLVPVDSRGADLGQTLAVWGIGEGLYLVWPLLGPSTVRDTVGTAGDIAASPFFWLTEPLGPVPFWPGLGADAGLRFNDMGTIINAYEAVTKGAVEPYIAARDAYIKYRRAGVLRSRVQW